MFLRELSIVRKAILMNNGRRKAKEYLKSIKTIKEMDDCLNALVLKDEEKQIAKDVYVKGLTHAQIAFKYNISIEKSHKVIQSVLDKVL